MTTLACFDCGVPYRDLGVDVALPDQQWKTLFPEEFGVLCANCICLRAKKHGGTVLLAWVDNIIYENHEKVNLSEKGTESDNAPSVSSTKSASPPTSPVSVVTEQGNE